VVVRNVAVLVFTDFHGEVRWPKAFALARFVNSLELVPNECFIKDPPRDTYYASA
jgi:hypothetical protein